MTKYLNHLDYTDSVCPDCGLEVDSYGNTEEQFDYCCFPNCGCDGSRLCMAPEGPNYASAALNIERGTYKPYE